MDIMVVTKTYLNWANTFTHYLHHYTIFTVTRYIIMRSSVF